MASKLLRNGAYEAENPFELSLREAFALLELQLRPPFQLTIPSPSQYSLLNQAILFGVLSEPNFAKVHIKHLHAIVTDGYAFFTSLLVKVVTELYLKLVESVKVQLLWVTSEMVDVSAVGMDGLLVSLLRQIVGGDFSDGNLWLCWELVRLLLAKWDCLLEEEPAVLGSALYVYLRLLADHWRLSSNAKLESLKQMEIEFCVRVLREQFHLCLRIGRDLIRLLQDLVHISEFRAIWKDLVVSPGEFGTHGFADISQLYCLRTPSRYFLLRITPEMETQLRFLLTHVKLGSQKRHQAWFARKFLCVPERETLITDIVRFICCAHHPSNEIIQSNVIPRWAVIGWLLKCCRKNFVEANVKLALFYDWLFFDEKVDNIMNIEPAILLMVNSIPKYIDMTHTLLEFLLLLMDNYDVERKDIIIRGVSSAFNILFRKRVVHSLVVLISSDVLSPYIKDRLGRFLFDAQLEVPIEKLPIQHPGHSVQPLSLPIASAAEKWTLSEGKLTIPACTQIEGFGSLAVDASGPISDHLVLSGRPAVVTDESEVDLIDNLLQNLGKTYQKSNTMGLQILEKIMFSFSNFDRHRKSNFVLNAEGLCGKIAKEFELNGHKLFAPLEFLPNQSNCDDEVKSATALITCAFIFSQHERVLEMLLFWFKNDLPVGARLLSYASRLAYEAQLLGYSGTVRFDNISAMVTDSKMPFLEFHIAKYMSFLSGGRKVSPEAIVSEDKKLLANLVERAFSAYKSFLLFLRNILQKEANISLAKLLVSDIRICSQWEKKRLKSLFCGIFYHFSDLSIGEVEIIRLLVNQLDHADLVAIQFDIYLKKFSLFGENTKTIYNTILSSLSWGSEEQHKLWGLIKSELVVSKVQVEKVVLEFFCSGVKDPNVNSIAIEGLLTVCTSHSPSSELVGAIMLLPGDKFQDFAAAVLATWAQSNVSMLFKSLSDFFEKLQNKSGDSPTILGGVMINQSAILWLLNFLDARGMKLIDMLGKWYEGIPDIKAKLGDVAFMKESR